MNFNKKQKNYTKNASVLFLAASMVACGQGGDSVGKTGISGAVTAPSGSVAFNIYKPSKFERFASSIFGQAHAAVTGVSSVGAGVTVELIEVDASGNKVGATLETTTTDADGKYTLFTDKSASSKYVVRATGTTEAMDIRFTSFVADVDPVSDAVSDLITSSNDDLSKMSTDEIIEIADAVDGLVQDVDPSNLSASALTTAIKTELNNNEEFSNQLTNTSSSEQICGNIKDASGNNVENIKIIVKDFSSWTNQAKTKTNSSGNYCVNISAGDYIVGAFNFTTSSTGASEWWSTSGTKYSPFTATKVTVAASSTATKDFTLEAGARITGKVTANEASSLVSGAGIQGVKVTIRNYSDNFPIAAKRANSSGTYTLNIIPGDYKAEAKNQTRFDYASEIHNGGTGTTISAEGVKLSLTAGTTTTLDFALDKGYKLSGEILDGAGGDAVQGQRINVNHTSGIGSSFRLRTNKIGKARIWLKPYSYKVESRGSSGTLDLTSSNQSVTLETAAGHVSLTLKDSDGNTVSQAIVKLIKSDGTTTITNDVSGSDGVVTLSSPTASTTDKVLVYIRGDRSYASTVYSGQTRVSDGTNVAVTVGSTNNLGTITLPTAGLLSVVVTSDGTTASVNTKVRVRDVGTSSTDAFVTDRTDTEGKS